jgi:conjugative relaxase-like TrwC/TraI family protein
MINPVRLKGKPGNIARYYTVGDYYKKGADERSAWGGRIAAELGLEGPVESRRFRELLSGQVDGQQLGRRRKSGEIEHHPAWDFTVSAPKSVSILALVMGDERIIAAHERAADKAFAYLEEHAALRRRVDGEVVQETTGQLLIAKFTEFASRECDPHLHTHGVVLNLTRMEGQRRMASLETRAMFAEQMTAGQIYRNEMAHAVRGMGHEIETDPRTGLFEIKGIPRALADIYSKRTEQIDEHAHEHGLSGQKERQKSFYATRRAKAKASLDTLRDRWTKEAAPFLKQLDMVAAAAERTGERALPSDPATTARAMLFGIRQAETREAVNNLGRMLRLGLASHIGETRIDDIRPLADRHEAQRKLLSTQKQTGDQILVRGRTSRRTARLEQALSQHLALALDDARPIAKSDRLLSTLEGAGLLPAQEQALARIATSRHRVMGIHGVAGAGKSTLVNILRAAAEPEAAFIAMAPTSSAAADLGHKAGMEARTVASLLATGGRGLSENHVLVLDEAGQLGNRQALRMLEISRETGARLVFLGDNKQTGAIEQGKAFWLMQRLGLPTAQLTEAVRQQTAGMKTAVAQARAGNYAASVVRLNGIVNGRDDEELAAAMVKLWTRLRPSERAATNILVLDNATRLIVNSQIRETLRREGVVAAEETRLEVLTPAGLTDVEKQMARFYTKDQVVTFGRDLAGAGIAKDAEYRVIGMGRDPNGRQIVQLVDENGRIVRWDPRLGSARHVNVFNKDERALASGDRIQWRLVNKELGVKNAERGTVQSFNGATATIRWDRDGRVQDVDLTRHKTWDHGYAETVYSAQSKTYDHVYVLAPVNSGLVNGKNYYTAITRARLSVRLWTEDTKGLLARLNRYSGEKTSSLEALDRLDRDNRKAFADRHRAKLDQQREDQRKNRQERRDQHLERQLDERQRASPGLVGALADRALGVATFADRFLRFVLERGREDTRQRTAVVPEREGHAPPTPSHQHAPSHGPER